jgi:hypothetical protein
MDCIAILDTSCIIWDSNDYDHNTHEYLNLKDKLVNLFDVFSRENPHILLRDELIEEMILAFPYESIHRRPHDYNHRVINFIINIPLNRKLSCLPQNNNVTSTPAINKAHFSANTQLEVSYILTKIHSTPADHNCYFAYPYLFGHAGPLTTTVVGHNPPLTCPTVFFDDETVLNNYFLQFRRVFQPNLVHHQQKRANSRKSRFRCYNGADTIVPQDYLDRSIFENNRYYFYDPVNEVYVVFLRHEQNRYHGHEEETLSSIPPRVRRHFNV